MNESYASRALRSTVTTVLAGLRDLTSQDLGDYQSASAGSRLDVPGRYSVVSDYRTSNGLPKVTSTQFAQDQAPSAGTAFFVRAQTGQGIEELFSEDLVTSDVYSVAPDHLAAFIQTESRRVPVDTTDLNNKLSFAAPPSSLHLRESDQAVVADEDTLTYERLRRSFDYTRGLIK